MSQEANDLNFNAISSRRQDTKITDTGVNECFRITQIKPGSRSLSFKKVCFASLLYFSIKSILQKATLHTQLCNPDKWEQSLSVIKARSHGTGFERRGKAIDMTEWASQKIMAQDLKTAIEFQSEKINSPPEARLAWIRPATLKVTSDRWLYLSMKSTPGKRWSEYVSLSVYMVATDDDDEVGGRLQHHPYDIGHVEEHDNRDEWELKAEGEKEVEEEEEEEEELGEEVEEMKTSCKWENNWQTYNISEGIVDGPVGMEC
ncbi:hypothetical protein JRQ81_005463 [Phrynocephalus forsythii]|uniref:Uncharacterized protein n=1 Tax=Phrynocephalus forsythii TaxID=171643 RepID=A0A9Q0XGC8_9SAUR|nr:hypothetical protein JRQ81_005463 [Phrynocephalus forsythii]